VNGTVVPRDGLVEVSGALTFDTVPRFFAASGGWLGSGSGTLTVDLRGVTRIDSAGVALLLEWCQVARQAGRDLAYTAVPEQVQHLIRVNGLSQAFNHG
jgi:phospholipid transport system transporter-binding protein